MGVQIDPTNNEPYIRLPAPHDNIRITPPRIMDADPLVQMLNDPKIYPFLSNPVFPVTQQHGVEFITRVKAKCEEIFYREVQSRLRDSISGSDAQLEGGFAVSGDIVESLREIQDDGTELYLGGLTLRRPGFSEVQDKFQRQILKDENDSKPPGDPSIVWAFGGMIVRYRFISPRAKHSQSDRMVSSHHGRGIMTVAIGTYIKEWAVPYLNAHKIVALTFADNPASRRVFEKNGFVCEGTAVLDMDLSLRGRKDTTVDILRWERGSE